MNKQVRSIRPYSGKPGEKIVAVNQNMGITNTANQQATTRVIYDAVKIVTSAQNQTLNLFTNAKSRSFPLTNLTENKLQVGESLAIQRMSFYIIQCTTGTTEAIGVVPLGYFYGYQRLYASICNFQIAQNNVLKNFPLASMFAPFNKDSRFMGLNQSQPAAGDLSTFIYPHDVYKFDSNTIIPEMIEFTMDVTIPPVTSLAGYDTYLACKLEGLGSLFSPKTNY